MKRELEELIELNGRARRLLSALREQADTHLGGSALLDGEASFASISDDSVVAPPKLAGTFDHTDVPPLLRFLRQLESVEAGRVDLKQRFVDSLAEPSGKARSLLYLYQMAAKEAPNPTLKLAKAIVDQSRAFAQSYGVTPLDFDDLLIGKSGGTT